MDGPANFSLPDDPVAPATELAAAKPVTPEVKPLYPSAAAAPTQSGPEGIRFDFNQGAACCLPPRTEGNWRVRLRDLDTGNTLFQSENQGAFVSSAKRFVRALPHRSLGDR